GNRLENRGCHPHSMGRKTSFEPRILRGWNLGAGRCRRPSRAKRTCLARAAIGEMICRMSGSHLEKLNELLATPELPELGPGPRNGIWEAARLNRSLDETFNEANLPDENQQLIRALVLLWHDHLGASHSISQNIANADGAFIHG